MWRESPSASSRRIAGSRPSGLAPTIRVSAVSTRPSTSSGPASGTGQGKPAAASARWASMVASAASRSTGVRCALMTTARPSCSSTPQTASMRPARKRTSAIALPNRSRAHASKNVCSSGNVTAPWTARSVSLISSNGSVPLPVSMTRAWAFLACG